MESAAPKVLLEIFIIKWLRTAPKRCGDGATGRRGEWAMGGFGICCGTCDAAATCEHFPICWIHGSKTICDLQNVQTTRLVEPAERKGKQVGRQAGTCCCCCCRRPRVAPVRIAARPNAVRACVILRQTRHENDLWQCWRGKGASARGRSWLGWSVSWPCRICRINAKCFKVVVDFGRARHRDWADCEMKYAWGRGPRRKRCRRAGMSGGRTVQTGDTHLTRPR